MTVFGIRPDFIRASVLLKKMAAHPDVELQFVYTGQHYDENLKEVFFRELEIPTPQYCLDTKAPTHAQQHAKLIEQLEEVIQIAKPDVVVFLGDANAVIGCITPLKMGVPIAHIEAGMRSYDWRMPEERNRVIVDRVSDVLYCYQHDYKYRLIQEGVDPDKIVVTGNTIVDVIEEHGKKVLNMREATLSKFGLHSQGYALQTLHRSENMNADMVKRILFQVNDWAKDNGVPVILPVMPRLQEILNDNKDKLKKETLSNYIFIEPLGFFEFLALESSCLIEFTDSGTNQETSALLGVPCVVTRRSTERPETFDSGVTVMTDHMNIYLAADYVVKKARFNENFSLGNGDAADIILTDLLSRLKNGFYKHKPPTNAFQAKNWDTYKEVT